MKRYIALLSLVTLASVLYAQTWKPRVELIGGKQTVKTLRIREGANLTVRTFAYDSLKQSTAYTGKFNSGTPNALKIKPTQVVVSRTLLNGVKHAETYSMQNYPGMTAAEKDVLSIPVADVHYLNYRVVPFDTEFLELGLLTAIAVLVVSPFVCINYQTGEFNAERYKWFGLGSTACLAVTFAAVITLGGSKTFNFREAPGQKGKVWKFLKD